jgi:hypothetical protein
VPLQRLFFMNSDFMQQQGERLARRVAPEPDNTARIQKAYRLIFGRAAPTRSEAGLAFLDRAAEDSTRSARRRTEGRRTTKDARTTKARADASEDGEGRQRRRDGMMAGVIPGAAKKDDEKKLLPATRGPLHENPAQLERIPLRGLTMSRHKSRQPITRRDALCRIGNGFGMLAFAGPRRRIDRPGGRPAGAGRRARPAQARSPGARQGA